MRSLAGMRASFKQVGWIVPPYVGLGALSFIAKEINDAAPAEQHDVLKAALARIYAPERLAAMVVHRYRVLPHVQGFATIISEGVQAHFLGLDHAAVASLVPVIEGIGRPFCAERGIDLDARHIGAKNALLRLADTVEQEVKAKRLGAVDEIVDMLGSFRDLVADHLFARTDTYAGVDGLNRHGIAHGVFADGRYGHEYAFFKAISVIDFLCFMVSVTRSGFSIMGPDTTKESATLAAAYVTFAAIMAKARPLIAAIGAAPSPEESTP